MPPPPSSGYYPGDLQSAYGLADAAAGFSPGPSAPTVAIVDAYDDPNAASDLAAYRASLSKATDQNTGIAGAAIPPLCSSTVTTGCATFTKVNQSGGKTYPPGNAGWAQEISLDLDMVSAICPNCNIVLVEASTSSFANLATAVSYAKSLHPAAITNSYGGGEFSSETSYNSTYSGTATTAITAASGDNGYGVEYPAASPGLTAVGGTSLSYDRTTSGLTWTQSVWSSAGSGCSSYEPMPSWQADQGVYSLSSDCTGRQTADVAAVANPSTGVAVYDTYSETGWLVFGGTSVSTQIIGATYALAAGSGTLQAAPSALSVDSLSASATGPTTGIVPVTTGSNATCGDYLCDAADSLSSGYNGPAGLGTPYGVSAFVTSATTSTGFGLTVTPASATVTQGNVTSYTVTVSPSGGFDSSVSLAEFVIDSFCHDHDQHHRWYLHAGDLRNERQSHFPDGCHPYLASSSDCGFDAGHAERWQGDEKGAALQGASHSKCFGREYDEYEQPTRRGQRGTANLRWLDLLRYSRRVGHGHDWGQRAVRLQLQHRQDRRVVCDSYSHRHGLQPRKRRDDIQHLI